jgi:hypothetical protein
MGRMQVCIRPTRPMASCTVASALPWAQRVGRAARIGAHDAALDDAEVALALMVDSLGWCE